MPTGGSGSGAEGGAGFSGVGAGGAPFEGSAPIAGSGASPSPGAGAKLMALLKDPEVLKALGQFGKDFGGALGSAKKLPPELQDMFKQVIAGGQNQGQNRPLKPAATGPYLGDIAAFTNPVFARNALREFGIPTGG